MKKIITSATALCLAVTIGSAQTPPLPIGYIPLADSATVRRDSPKSLRPKPKGAGAPAKAAQKQVGLTTAARPAAAAAAAVVVVPPPVKMLKLIWIDGVNPPDTTYNVYSRISVVGPYTLITNVTDKSYTFPADKPMEFFQVKALRNGLESGWGTPR